MNLVHLRCAGLDVHKKTVVACVCIITEGGEVLQETRSFLTMTSDLLALSDWLESQGVTSVAMESTGVYWKPVFHILEERFEVMLVNAHHIKNVPGRKTDVKDAAWIAQLLQHGLLSPSFVPPPPIRNLRDLTRQRTQLVREKATAANRIQKVLEDANIKLASVASDPLGVSGRAMIRGLIVGGYDVAALAEKAKGRMRSKIDQLQEALHGRVTEHHRFLLRMLMDQIEQWEGLIEQFDGRISQVMKPFAEAAERLRTIPGIGVTSSQVILAEIGTDRSQFPTAGHLASWAGMCPGNHQSGGKRRKGRTTKGDQWLRGVLIQVSWAATHCKANIFSALYRRWAKRLGKKKALVAIGHKILVRIHKLLKHGLEYEERLKVTPAPADVA